MNGLAKQTNYYKESAERDFKTAKDLFKTKHYDACLFFCHLALEKTLKSLIIGTINDFPPYTHDLPELAKIAKLKLTDKQVENLKIITKFNIAGRYENYKYDFYKKCTKDYTSKYLEMSDNLIIWLTKQYQ